MGILFDQIWPKSSQAWFLCHFNESPASNTRCESCKYSVKCWSMLKPGPATDTSARFSTGVVQTHDKNSSRLQQARMFFLHIQVYWQFASFWAAFSVNVFVHNRLSVRIDLNNSNLARRVPNSTYQVDGHPNQGQRMLKLGIIEEDHALNEANHRGHIANHHG